ncbi:coiled-coil domain-containing protein 81-like [Nyctibius grandis]|uniref:coiled-coil domain-containing protein 81-like n=1 Tax=Nyctibius grandis TaxID=48427 RepID=UPI0035BC3B90
MSRQAEGDECQSGQQATPDCVTVGSIVGSCHVTMMSQWLTGCWRVESRQTEHDLIFLCFPERRAIWNAVSGYVQEQLLLHKGVRIPALGSFDTVPEQIQVGSETVTVQRPVFHLARNLIVVLNLMDEKAYVPDIKELEPLKYAKVATAASVSQLKAESCIQGTMSLLSQCLGKGKNIALVLKDVGVLLIEDRRVKMKIFYAFLEMMSGKENLEKAVFKVPGLLDTVVSQVVPVASLTLSVPVIIFPEFELEFMSNALPKDVLKTLRKAEDKEKIEEILTALTQGKKDRVECGDVPSPADSILEALQLQQMVEKKKKKEPQARLNSENEPLEPEKEALETKKSGFELCKGDFANCK